MKTYDYEWDTIEKILENKDTKLEFQGWGETTISDVSDNARDEEYKKAHELWLKLKDAFNKESEIYDNPLYQSRLGSIGEKEEREVLRSMWWDFLNGDDYGDYRTITRIIELLHDGEKIESGTIHFGS